MEQRIYGFTQGIRKRMSINLLNEVVYAFSYGLARTVSYSARRVLDGCLIRRSIKIALRAVTRQRVQDAGPLCSEICWNLVLG